MAKPEKPLLSLGARGTIADSLTFQKRNQGTMVRTKPIPKDPRSEAQMAQRQRYRDAVDAWHALSPAEKEAWRGVCPGLTAYQCFMSSELRKGPPPPGIDIGADAIDRTSYSTIEGATYIDKNNPANESGTITSVEIWVKETLANCIVGTFYKTNGSTFKCRDSEVIGSVIQGSKQTFPVSITVEAGDYIGFYSNSGQIERSTADYAGVLWVLGEHIDSGDEASYSLWDGDAISLHGIGEATP